ncbi:hypothetical protein VSU19_19925 [Verrucomicrobiales bacterium BCK34]|nr:hypothetical protein [Verrucomicrobiales bacterium BCK34]
MTLGVNAGDWGKAPVAPSKAPIEECYDIGGTISAGYMSDYIFYGSRQAKDAVWTGVDYTIDSVVPITIGAWYLNGIDPSSANFDELDLFASAALGTYGGFDVSLGYTHYFYPENPAVASYGEIGLDLTRSLGFVDLALETNYALTIDAWYHQAGIEKTFGLTDSMSLVIGAGVGYADGYTGTGSSWSHYYANASLPIELNCRATLTPYVGWNGVPVSSGFNAIDLTENGTAGSDVLHAGVSLSVSF